jgi:hypothetical protein
MCSSLSSILPVCGKDESPIFRVIVTEIDNEQLRQAVTQIAPLIGTRKGLTAPELLDLVCIPKCTVIFDVPRRTARGFRQCIRRVESARA